MPKASILIVEDESVVALDIQQRLLNMGYQVADVVNSGEMAIQKARMENPDLVLMDIKLKGAMDGIQAAEIIHERQKLPIIFLTAFADELTLKRARITESFGYILKPFEERELSINIDIALYKNQMEKKLRESEERYRLAVQGANDGLWDWDLRTGIIYYSQRWMEMLELTENEVVSSVEEWYGFIHPEDLEKFKLELANHLAGLTPYFQNESRFRTSKGALRWMLTRGVAVRDSHGAPYRMAGSQSDVTERKLAEQQLLHDAFHDPLTGLPNRALFLDRLDRAMERARRNDRLSYSVLFLDLDRFKIINDSLGHQLGDRLLIDFSKRIGHILRASDTLARFGGDELVILLDELNAPNDSILVCERIQADLKNPFLLNDQPVFISVSIGIVSGSSRYLRPEDILRDADIAMYRAKAEGKGRYAVFESKLYEHAVNQLALESDLRLAIDRQEFVVYYQPVLSLETGKVTGFEALLRWFHPVRGLISPVEFIHDAEETGLILPIGQWVIKEACSQLRQWQKTYPQTPPLTVSVNISGRQLSQTSLVDQIAQILKETKLDPRTLKLEIAESLLMEKSKAPISTLNRIRGLGVQLLIDDFGTGYSSLGYVHKFPVDTIKIDRLFINQMITNGYQSDITDAIIHLAQELGMSTIAKGIETEEQLASLKEMACQYGQGWLFSKAVEKEKIDTFLQEFNFSRPTGDKIPGSLSSQPDIDKL